VRGEGLGVTEALLEVPCEVCFLCSCYSGYGGTSLWGNHPPLGPT